jgi:hypothetical protein
MRRRGLGIFGLTLIAVIALALIPLETAIVPAWHITVLDEHGMPYVGQRVDEFWANYDLELGVQHGEERWTNEFGRIDFPSRSLKMSAIERIIRRILAKVNRYLHGSKGVEAYLMTTVPEGIKTLQYESNKPPPDRWILPRH